MKTIFFLSFFVLLSLGLMGQSNLSLEISAHGMVTPAPRLGGIGLGQQVRGALNYKMGATGALELFAGYRMQHGYSQKAVTVEERSLPTEYQLIVNSNQLTGFSYLDVGLGYQWSLGNTQRWQVGVAAQAAYLMRAKGETFQSYFNASSYYVFLSESAFTGSSSSFATAGERVALSQDDFQKIDLGLNLSISYMLTPGLSLQAGCYQGLLDPFGESAFAEDKPYRITNIFVGFSARL
jgi:hypothetical protein